MHTLVVCIAYELELLYYSYSRVAEYACVLHLTNLHA